MQHFSQIVPRVCTSVLFSFEKVTVGKMYIIVSNAFLLPRHAFTLSKHAQLMAEGLHFSALSFIINPRHACAAKVTVVGLCVCMYVCSNLPPHTLESQKRDTNGFIAIWERFLILTILLKMLCSKFMA